MSSIALIANGVIHDFKATAELVKKYQSVVAVDGGLLHCSRMDVKPNLIIGDLDSVSHDLLTKYADVARQKFPEDKDETDLELAVRVVDGPEVKKIVAFGALERRTDHALCNLHLICKYPQKLYLENERELLFAIDRKVEIKCFPGQTVSLIPMSSPALGVTTKGLKWEMQNANLDKNFMSVSNVCLTSTLHIEINEGDLICCLAK